MSVSERDFKGVWIPREIWLNTELTLLEKAIFTEIDSLDNENHCIASNDYFAEFCDCSASKVSKAIKKLKDLGMIEELEFDGRRRKLRVVKSARQGSKKCYADKQKMLSSNIDSKKENIVKNSKELENFQLNGVREQKQSLYSKCLAEINYRDYSKELKKALTDYLQVRLQIKDKPLYANSWKGLLNKLEREFEESDRLQVVYQSIERGYASFFPVNKGFTKQSNNQLDKPWEQGVSCKKMTKEQEIEHEKWLEEMRAKGVRVDF